MAQTICPPRKPQVDHLQKPLPLRKHPLLFNISRQKPEEKVYKTHQMLTLHYPSKYVLNPRIWKSWPTREHNKMKVECQLNIRAFLLNIMHLVNYLKENSVQKPSKIVEENSWIWSLKCFSHFLIVHLCYKMLLIYNGWISDLTFKRTSAVHFCSKSTLSMWYQFSN